MARIKPRIVAWVDPLSLVEGKGFRVSLVVEGEDGHHPTGTWPYEGKHGQTMPWFWGPTLLEAEAAAEDYNGRRGISREDAWKIVAASMRRGLQVKR